MGQESGIRNRWGTRRCEGSPAEGKEEAGEQRRENGVCVSGSEGGGQGLRAPKVFTKPHLLARTQSPLGLNASSFSPFEKFYTVLAASGGERVCFQCFSFLETQFPNL